MMVPRDRPGGSKLRLRPVRPDSLGGLIDRFPIVSCDVFDTAVGRRLARPVDLHLATGARLLAQGLDTCTPEAFREYRVEAERALRRELVRPDGEVRIDAVYERLHACGVVTDAVAAAALEFAVERAVTVAIDPVRRVLENRRAEQRLIFISDTMLPGPWVARLLSDCGYGDELSVFTSADLGHTKQSGRLFRTVMAALGCRAADLVHIGDDPNADIVRARENGIVAFYLPRTRVPPEPDDNAGLHHVARLAHSYRRSQLARAAVPATADLFRYCSLLLIGYTLFVLAAARRQGIRRIFFLARDGYLPLAIARRITGRIGDGVELGYLYVSRQSIVLPTLGDDPDGLAELLGRSLWDRPLAVALDMLGLGQVITPQILRHSGMHPDQLVATAAERDTLRRMFNTNRELVCAHTRHQRTAALAYLAQSGFLAPGLRLLVDGGWRGSTHKALVSLTGLPAADLIGCYPGLVAEALAPGFDPRVGLGYLFSFGHPRQVMEKVLEGYALCEFFLSAPHCATTHYAFEGAKAVPVLAVEPEPGATIRRQAMEAIEAQCLAEVDALDNILGGAWPDGIDPASALFDLEPLLTRPTARQVADIGSIHFIGGFDNTHLMPTVSRVPLSKFLRDPREAIRQLKTAPWRSGAMRASLPWPLGGMSYAQFQYRAERLLTLFRHA